ncbi:MAG: hypothetical protein IJ134_00490 [Bacilli bacterium]|nr:hypothetical protein [Bacilli bacterium]
MSKKYLKVAGIINIIFGSIFILSIIGFIIGVPLLINGILFEEYSRLDDEKLKTKKNNILVWSIVLLLFNVITAVIGFIAYEKIDEKEEAVNAEVKRLDLLLKFGVLMVCFAGIAFATTSWDIIDNEIKTISLLIFSAFFFILYIISSKFIKIKSTSITYYILGWLFIIFSYISVIYFNIGGITFGKISMSVMFLLIAACSYITHVKFSSDVLLHISIISVLVSLFLFVFEYLTIGYSLIILALISVLGNVLSNKKIDFDISLYATSFAAVLAILFSDVSSIERIILTIIIICTLFIKAYDTNKNVYNILFLIVSYAIVLSNFSNCDLTSTIYICISGALMSISLLELSFDNKNSFIVSTLISNLILFVIYLTQIGETNCYYLNLIIALFMIIPTLIGKIIDKSNELCELIEPIQVAAIIEGIRYCMSPYIDVYNNNFSFVTPLILSIISLFKTKELNKNSYYVVTLVMIAFLFYTANLPSLFSFILISFMIYVKEYMNREKSNTYIVAYVAMLFITFNSLNIIGEKYDILLPISLIQIGLFIIYSLINNNKILKNLTLFIIYIPYLNLRNSLELHENVVFACDYAIIVYYSLLISSFIKNTNDKKVFITIALSMINLSLIISNNPISGILAGIISLAAIYVGFFKEEYDVLYKAGFILGVINIIYKLRDIWSEIPFWAYLLIAGFSIILFVTYKQFKSKK